MSRAAPPLSLSLLMTYNEKIMKNTSKSAEKVILYYKFVPISDPRLVCMWQRELCEKLGLRGRILVSAKGINGTLGGPLTALKLYTRAMKDYELFKGIVYKWSDGGLADFPKLVVKVRNETVTLGIPEGIEVNERGVVGGGQHLKPSQVNEFVKQNPDVIFFDGRNNYESAIGKFKDAVTPDVQTFKEMPTELDKPKYKALKNKKIITYCTGGIRCETLSALMKQKGFTDVYQIEGGIVKYGETFGDSGLWEGKCFVFDKRMHVAFSKDSKDIGDCVQCGAKTSNYENCAEPSCNKLILQCEACKSATRFCSEACAEKAAVTSGH